MAVTNRVSTDVWSGIAWIPVCDNVISSYSLTAIVPRPA